MKTELEIVRLNIDDVVTVSSTCLEDSTGGAYCPGGDE